MQDTVKKVIEDLTGQAAPFARDLEPAAMSLLNSAGMGYSQMNELLLTLGYDRVTPAFFQFVVSGAPRYEPGAALTSLEQLREGVERFRKLAALRFGNIKYAFGHFSELDETRLADELAVFEPVPDEHYAKRHAPLIPVEPIAGNETYFLGYLIKRELDNRIAANPDDADARNQLERRAGIVAKGKRNHEAYLASDHMDVYVATSMRERHEYQIVNQVVSKVFADDRLANLRLRWFDPTQAYCEDRIDKGLAEGLMLKRATCTLYLAQENDTLGKDSELASTLAQGKPVIAFIPQATTENEAQYVSEHIELVMKARAGASEADIVMEQLRVFAPDLAWRDPDVIKWLSAPSAIPVDAARAKLGRAIREHYDKRASTLRDTHPLGIQVHLETGVANGVLVARSVEQCSELIWRVMTNRLELDLQRKDIAGTEYLLLVERLTGSVFRVVSGDAFLTNAFWNFYLPQRIL